MIQTWTYIDKSKWPTRGPWDEEPDKAQWKDLETGLDCIAVRHPRMGSWCGYVGVPEGHKMHGAKDISEDPLGGLEVHGSVSYAGACDPRGHSDSEGRICHIPAPGEPDDLWWIGFDCAHAWDLVPELHSPKFVRTLEAAMSHTAGSDVQYRSRDMQYRTLGYVMGECAALAAQLAE